jgi:NTP pyrophosphatase (non-canonical NTP hydrolase)
MNFEQLKENVVQWADDKGLLEYENAPKQMLKVVEELGELCGAIAKGKRAEEIDAFGDVLVTLIILAEQRNVSLVNALEVAYDEIKGRTGKKVDGVFIKDDLLHER